LKQPKSIFHVAGTEDRQILFADQQQAIEAAKGVNGISGMGTACGNGCTLYSSGGARIMTWINSGGHVYPPTTSEKITKFFRDSPK
jgi:hypothetical protein